MSGSFHFGSATTYNVMDMNLSSTSPVNILVLEGMDIEKDNCGDAFKWKPTKLPSVRNSMSQIS
jgi:hypothetical protein